jgi:hypothetical protein
LATLVEVHLSVRAALIAWADELPPEDAEAVRRVAALVRLGIGPADACSSVLGEAGVELGEVLARAETLGGRVGRSLTGLASSLEERQAMCRARDTSAAGATLSSRIVVALPALVSAVALARSGVRVTTAAITLLGAAAIAGGIRWLARAKPVPPPDTEERLALAVAEGVEGGACLEAILSRLAEDPAYAEGLSGPRASVSGGALWPEALAASDLRVVRSIGRACLAARRYGRPLGPILRTIAADAARSRTLAYERALRLAPVRMVLPLTLCVLPGSLLLAAAPFVT